MYQHIFYCLLKLNEVHFQLDHHIFHNELITVSPDIIILGETKHIFNNLTLVLRWTRFKKYTVHNVKMIRVSNEIHAKKHKRLDPLLDNVEPPYATLYQH